MQRSRGLASILILISRFVVEGHARMSGQLHWMQELLRILPDLGGMRAEGEPETNKIREKEDCSTKVHQAFDRRLVEGIVHRVWMLVITVVANPWSIPGSPRQRRTPAADQLEIAICLIE